MKKRKTIMGAIYSSLVRCGLRFSLHELPPHHSSQKKALFQKNKHSFLFMKEQRRRVVSWVQASCW